MKKKLIVPLVILLVLIVTLVSSVAFFSLATEGQTESSIQIGELTFKYTETSGKGQGINLDDAFPLSDTEGKALTEYFDFKVEGNLTRSDLTYTVELDTTLSDLPDSGIKLYLTEIVNGNEVELNSIVNTLSTYQASDNGRIIYSETIPRNTKNYVKNFRLRMWIDESVDWTDDLYMGHSGTFKVNVKANSNTSVAATDVVTDRTTSLERIVANDKYLFTASTDTGVDYEVTVPYTVNNVDIEVYESNTQATSVVTPINSLSGVSSKSTTQNIHTGNNYFKVTTTASNGTTTGEHILKVVKEADTNNDLLNLGVEGYSLTPVFDKDTLAYTLTLEEPSITITGNKASDTASITGLGEKTLAFGDNTFNITVTPEDTNTSAKTYTITVTNSRPIAPAITGGTGTSWTNAATTITLANPNSAFAISGIDHYEVYDTNTSTAPTDSTVATTTTTESYIVNTAGTHYVYYRTVSNKGFKSVWSNAQIANIDTSAPTNPTITASDGKATNTWHIADFNLNFSATKNGNSSLKYYYGTSSNPTTLGSGVPLNSNTNTTYYMKACNEAGVCSSTVSYIVKLDKSTATAPTLTGGTGSGTWGTTTPVIKVATAGTSYSSVSTYEYYKTTSTTAPNANTTATGTTSGNLSITDEVKTYVYYRTVANSGKKSAWSSAQTVNLTSRLVPTYGSSIPTSVSNIYYTLDGKTSAIYTPSTTYGGQDYNYKYTYMLGDTTSGNTSLFHKENTYQDGTKITAAGGTNTMTLSSTVSNRWLFVNLEGGYTLPNPKVMGSIKLVFNNGNSYTIQQAVNNGYIEPLVLYQGGGLAVGTSTAVSLNVSGTLTGGNTTSADYPGLRFLFKVKNVSPLKQITFYTNNAWDSGNHYKAVLKSANFDISTSAFTKQYKY